MILVGVNANFTPINSLVGRNGVCDEPVIALW